MADRYWVGGTGTWSTTLTTNWSATSGGSGGASAPTAADNVFFNSASGVGTVAVAAGTIPCLNFTVDAAFGGSFSFANSTTLNVSGNFDNSCTTALSWGSNTLFNFVATTTGKTIKSATSVRNVAFASVNGGWTLLNGFTITGNLTVSAGTFNTGNFNFTISGAFLTTTTSAKTINLGSSTINVGASVNTSLDFATGTNITLNAGTSTINITLQLASHTFNGGSKTFNNVNYVNTINSGHSLVSITGANTFNNLSFPTPLNNGMFYVTFNANQTISGVLSQSNALSAAKRIMFSSNSSSTIRTLTLNASPILSNIDFQDITINGTASPISGTNFGDCQNNSGITFPAPKTVYWGTLSGTQEWSANGWALTSGGTPAVDNFPLAQDIAVINNSSAITQFIQATIIWNVGSIDLSARTTALSQLTFNARVYGNITLGSGVTASSFGATYIGTVNQTLTTNGRSVPAFTISKRLNSTLFLGSSLNITGTGSVNLNTGGFDANGFDANLYSFTSSSGSARTLSMGSGTWRVGTAGTSVWSVTAAGLTFNKGTANIEITNNSTQSADWSGGGLTYNKITVTGQATLAIATSDTFSEIACTYVGTSTPLRLGSNITVTTNTWSITGAAGAIKTIAGNTNSRLAIVNRTSNINYLSITNIAGVNTTPITFWAGANSTNTTNCTGIAFADGTTNQAYILSTGTTFATPADWNNDNNFIYLFGGGGGGGGGAINTTNNYRAAGGGGGGGGFGLLTNQSLSGNIFYTVGAGGAGGAANSGTGSRSSVGGNGGTTSWNIISSNYSGYFSGGTGNNLSVAANDAFTFGTGNFTIECWVNASATQQSWAGIVTRGSSGSGRWTLNFRGTANAGVDFWSEDYSSGSAVATSTTPINDGAWHHIAAVRNGNVFTIYVDGIAGSTTTTTATTMQTSTSPLLIGLDAFSANRYFVGYTSNVRIVKGTALYTANFTPPTAPLTAVTNTSLLTCQSSTFIDNSVNNFTVTAVGSASVSSLSPFFTSSISATGGTGGSASTVTPSSTGGTVGTGIYTGGTGGTGGTAITATAVAGGGGGGSGGVNGNGGNGGNGISGSTLTVSAGGGGGSGGGTAGSNGIADVSGAGGNNYLGVGSGTSVNNLAGNPGFRGGGGSGGEGDGRRGGNGGTGIDILASFGSGGGSGGGTNVAQTLTSAGLFGAGGGGAGTNATTTAYLGCNGAQGAIIIVYSTATVSSTGNFLLWFF